MAPTPSPAPTSRPTPARDLSGGDTGTLVTRLSAASTVAEGHKQVFGPQDGRNFTTRDAVPAMT